jgi:curved DNA-binding protein CbpA
LEDNWYEILEVDKRANQEEIKNAYYELGKKYHPDVNSGKDDEEFKKISVAYEILSDKKKRREYDISLTQTKEKNANPHNHDSQNPFFFSKESSNNKFDAQSVLLENRMNAIKKTNDQTVLEDIAKNAKYNNLRKVAIEKLTNRAVLEDIAKNAKPAMLRKVAVKRITIERISNQTILEDIAKNKSGIYDLEIREKAIKKISVQSVLKDIAKNAKPNTLRKVAVKKMETFE